MSRLIDLSATVIIHIVMPFVVIGLLIMVAIEKVRK